MIFGKNSFPTPLSPVISTDTSVGATCIATFMASFILGLMPTMPKRCFTACRLGFIGFKGAIIDRLGVKKSFSRGGCFFYGGAETSSSLGYGNVKAGLSSLMLYVAAPRLLVLYEYGGEVLFQCCVRDADLCEGGESAPRDVECRAEAVG